MSDPIPCSLPDCKRFVNIALPYTIAGSDSQYCSSRCAQFAWDLKLHELKRKKKAQIQTPEEPEVEVPATDFGEAGITRLICDRLTCRRPVTLRWKGRYGVYCSNECLKISEKEGYTQMTEEQTATATAAAPIAAGKPSTKKAASKKAAATVKGKGKVKAAPKSKAPKAAGANSKFQNDQTIKVKSTDHTMRGARAEAQNLMKDGMTVGDFRAAIAKKDLDISVGPALERAIAAGLISVK